MTKEEKRNTANSRERVAQQVFVELNPTKFKYIEGNRHINNLQVKSIAAEMKKYGYVGAPIVVDKEHRIIEGQHRVAAAIETGTPVKYIVEDRDVDIELIQRLNSTQSKWKDIDYVQSRADTGDTNCKFYCELWKEFVKENRSVTNSTVAEVVLRTYGGASMQEIKEGKFNLTLEGYTKAREELAFISKCYNILKEGTIDKRLGRNDYFGRAVLFMIDSGADKDRIEQVLAKSAYKYQSTSTVDDALLQLSNYYNYGLSAKSKIQFLNLYIKYKQDLKIKRQEDKRKKKLEEKA